VDQEPRTGAASPRRGANRGACRQSTAALTV
jgi:hypothetical protein